MARKIQHKRGLEANLPQLDVAEIAFTTDSKKPFIGSADGNVEIAKKADVDEKASKTELTNAVSPKADKTYVDTELGKKASTDEVSAVSTQLAEKASQADVTAAVEPKADKIYVDAELGKKATKGEIAVTDIDKNKGKFDQTYMSEEFLQQMAGTTPINAVPADDSIGLRKTTFAKPKKNLLNPEKVTEGYVINESNGELVADVAWANVTEYIEVIPHEYYVFSKGITNVAFYDESKNFISIDKSGTSTLPLIKKIPSGSYYVRATIYDNVLPTAQIEKGFMPTSHEPFELVIANEFIEKRPIEKQDIPKIGIQETTLGVNISKNLFNKDTVFLDTGLNQTTGEIYYNNTYATSEFIRVAPGASYALTNVNSHAWYTADKNFIAFKAGGFIEVAPDNAIYLKVMVAKTNLESAQVERGTARTAYAPYREVIDRKYLDLPESGGSTSRNENDEFARAMATENALNFVPNVPEPLNIPTYDGSNAPTHPSVLYFPDGWNGYKFWMAMTPYPNSDNKFENPSIVASNDNITWVEPAPNPVAELRPENNYQSDPCILMNGDTMELWFRVSTMDGQYSWGPTEFYRMTTIDGVNWTERELMFNGSTFEDEILSPTIRREDGKYRMWYILSDKENAPIVKYAESFDGKTWESRVLSIPAPADGYTFWHGSAVQHDDGSVEMAIMCKHNTKRWAVFYTNSPDNITFSEPVLIIKSTNPSRTRWDSSNLYHPWMMVVGDEYYVYYSTPSKIGLTKGKSMLTLGVGVDKFSSYPDLMDVKVKFGAQNAFASTAPYTAFPSETIVYFMVWSSTSAGWPELSGTVKTENLFKEQNRAVQYFYPTGSSNYYYKRSASSSGWSAWLKYTGTTA